MSTGAEQFREAVVRRAGNRCEYCQLPAQLQVSGFEIDHILPRSRGGQTDLSNVALACPHCNARKWAHIDGEDLESGQWIALFNNWIALLTPGVSRSSTILLTSPGMKSAKRRSVLSLGRFNSIRQPLSCANVQPNSMGVTRLRSIPPFCAQEKSSSCLPACLRMVLMKLPGSSLIFSPC